MALTDCTDCTELPLAPLALLRGFRAIAKARACLYTRLKHGWPVEMALRDAIALQRQERCGDFSSIPQIRRV